MSKDATTLPYRDGVGMMLINAQGKVFVAKRIDMVAEAWQMPQGGVDVGESPKQAVLREIQEEICTDKASILRESPKWHYYDLPDDLIPKIWGGEYRGQRQRWFALRFEGSDADIDINTAHPEFCQWQWIEMEKLPGIIVPFKRALYAQLAEEFRDLT
jgi:putative (di)nucleoside polyphosphate hydrolase